MVGGELLGLFQMIVSCPSVELGLGWWKGGDVEQGEGRTPSAPCLVALVATSMRQLLHPGAGCCLVCTTPRLGRVSWLYPLLFLLI